MEKINIAELLKDCPKGMELDCTMFNNVVLYGVNGSSYPISILAGGCKKSRLNLTKTGCCYNNPDAKCVIFPKGKTTWEGFHRPFKDGDIVYIRDEYSDATFTYVAIFKQIENGGHIYSHCFYNYEAAEFSTDDYLYDIYRIRFATEDEKEKLFDAIKANGYKWNEETKTLEKLIAPSKFDITSLKPFDKVLVRHNKDNKWCCSFFSHIDKNFHSHCYKFVTTSGKSYPYCIPHDGNQELRGTTNDCDEYYKTW